ncbi:YbaB/EbfC family nucleoid-associated protein [Lentzea californiensis]|uniref:YbaB/EbfC family nucleoid-associated protein n=1 Tax=Lentzea californiensis TaxID=438851 RepID=UPI0021654ED8|nr:YbaB/EbfC family nucleoid-associated protein [Lentzea californiensis]MCR3753586.1 Conserved DNA-binding protein YbaB [Lentzea californiensis]
MVVSSGVAAWISRLERGVDQWVEGLQQRADRLERLRSQADRIQVPETSQNGAVTVTIDATGKPLDIRFDDRAAAVRPSELGPLVMGCIRAAQSRIAQQVREATAAAVGDDLPTELRSHAGKLDGLAERLGQALHAARTVSMDDAAYGQICAFLPPLPRDIEQQAYDALVAGNNGVTEIATNIRRTADESEDFSKPWR